MLRAMSLAISRVLPTSCYGKTVVLSNSLKRGFVRILCQQITAEVGVYAKNKLSRGVIPYLAGVQALVDDSDELLCSQRRLRLGLDRGYCANMSDDIPLRSDNPRFQSWYTFPFSGLIRTCPSSDHRSSSTPHIPSPCRSNHEIPTPNAFPRGARPDSRLVVLPLLPYQQF